MKVTRNGAWSIIWLIAVLVVPQPLAAREAETCAQSYMLCINEASQGDDGWFERTMAEQRCNLGYLSCLKRQATEL